MARNYLVLASPEIGERGQMADSAEAFKAVLIEVEDLEPGVLLEAADHLDAVLCQVDLTQVFQSVQALNKLGAWSMSSTLPSSR